MLQDKLSPSLSPLLLPVHLLPMFLLLLAGAEKEDSVVYLHSPLSVLAEVGLILIAMFYFLFYLFLLTSFLRFFLKWM